MRFSTSNQTTANSTTGEGVLASTMRVETVRRFTGNKIAKVRFLHDQSEKPSRVVSGTWGSNGRGNISIWDVRRQNGVSMLGGSMSKEGEGIQKICQIDLCGADVTDICVINAQQCVISTTTGELFIVNCSSEADDQNEPNKRSQKSTLSLSRLKKHPTSLCMLNNELFAGCDSGQIMRIQLDRDSLKDEARLFAQDLMGVTSLTHCGPFGLISAHTTGQIHLWDIRKKPMSAEFGGIQPVISRPVSALNHAVTALSTHPAQHNVIAFGSQDGIVSFIDIRQTNQLFPVAFKVSQDPINEIKFHPIFANNCFSCSDSGLIHWDASSLAREMNIQSKGIDGQEDPELAAAMMEADKDCEHKNIWLSARASTNINLRILVDEPLMLSSFDVMQGAIVVGSHHCELAYFGGANFTN